MNTTSITLLIILLSIVVVYASFNAVPYLVRILKRKFSVFSVRSTKRRAALMESFLVEKRPGKFFVEMIGTGLLRSIKTINHGQRFPDKKHMEVFKKYSTPQIKEALDKIGEGI